MQFQEMVLGSSHNIHAPRTLLTGAALVGVLAIFIIFTSTANSQFLKASINYAGISSQIIDIRFGEHADKTRMVIDIQHPTDLTYKTSKDGKTIYLNLPRATWDTTKAFRDPHITGEIINFSHAPLLEGSKLTLKSSTPIIVKPPFFLPPTGRSGHRIVIDFMTATAPIITKPTLNMVATLDNMGALPNDQNVKIAQLTHQQNPYIQRAFPQSNMKQKRTKASAINP